MRSRRDVLMNAAAVFVIGPVASWVLWWGIIAAVRWLV